MNSQKFIFIHFDKELKSEDNTWSKHLFLFAQNSYSDLKMKLLPNVWKSTRNRLLDMERLGG